MSSEEEAAAAAAAIAVAGAVAGAHASAMSEEARSPAGRSQGSDREAAGQAAGLPSPGSQRSPQGRSGGSRMSALYGADEASEVYAKLGASDCRAEGASGVPPLRFDAEDMSSKASTSVGPEASLPQSAREDAWGALALPSGRNSGVDSFDEHQRAISSLHRRQAEWDRQMEFHDQKQGELLTLQWKLMREQTGTLARELAIVQQQLQEVRVDTRRTRAEVDQFSRETDARFTEERSLRQSAAETSEQRLRKARLELEADIKARVAPLSDVQRRLQSLEDRVGELSHGDRSLEAEVAKLNKKVDGSLQDILALQQALDQEAVERRTFEDSSLDMLRELKEALQKEARERSAFNEDCANKQLSRMNDERLEREQAYNALHQRILTLQKEMAPQKEELPMLRTRLQDLENLMNSRLKDSQKIAEREIQDRAATLQKLERRVAELQGLLEKEASARLQQAEDFEQVMKNHRTKTKTLVAEQADLARQAREEIHGRLMDQLERETAIREAQRLDLVDQFNTCRSCMEQRADSFEGTLRSLEQQIRDEGSSATQALEATCLRQMDVLSRQLRETSDTFQAKLREEKEAREAQDASLEDHVAFLDNFLQDVRQFFLQTGSRTRTMGLRKSMTPSARPALEASSPLPGQRMPSRPSSPGGRSNH